MQLHFIKTGIISSNKIKRNKQKRKHQNKKQLGKKKKILLQNTGRVVNRQNNVFFLIMFLGII